jgi:hypothetical protein
MKRHSTRNETLARADPRLFAAVVAPSSPAAHRYVAPTLEPMEEHTLRAPTRRRVRARWLTFLIPVIAGGVGVWSLDRAHAFASNAYGLISVLPVLSLASVGIVTVSFVIVLARAPQRAQLLYVHVVTMVVLLYGAAPLSEHEGRQPTAFYIVGNINHIAATGQLLFHTDARWSWPGMFSGVAALLAPAGLSSALPLLLWAPVVFMLAYSLPLLAIGRALAPPRVAWLGLWLFYLADWSGQEYFSPQAVAFFFFLALLAVTLTYLRRTDRLFLPLPRTVGVEPGPRHGPGRAVVVVASWPGRLGRWLRNAALAEPAAAPATKWQQAGLIVVWVVTAAALTVSHQLTPVVLVADLMALAVVGRLLRNEVAYLAIALVVIYISYLTTDFWQGHLDLLLGLGGNSGTAAIQSNVGGHLTGNPGHHVVLDLRLGLTGSLWLAGAVGVLRHVRRRRINVSLVVLAWLPLSIPLVQPYGGEALIRAFLLGLPFMALLAASAILPDDRARRLTWIGLTLVLLVLIPVFFVDRYGNEQFEATRPGELAAMRYLYAHAPAGSTFMVAATVVPWQYTDQTTYNYAGIAATGSLPTVSDVVASVRSDLSVHTYVLFTTEEQDNDILNLGAPAGWLDRLGDELIARPDFSTVLRNQDALILEYTNASIERHG